MSNDDCGGGEFPTSEPIGQTFIASLGLTGEWLQTSYNNNFRGIYAGGGFSYDADADVFVAPISYDADTDIFIAPTVEPAKQ